MYLLALSGLSTKGSPAARRAGLLLLGLLIIFGGLFLFLSLPEDSDDPFAGLSDEEILEKARAFYASRPHYERPHDYSPVPAGLPDLRSETCGQCHAAIYAEWRISTHARAFLDDAQFMEELHKSSGQYDEHHPNDVSWMCLHCHTPMINQLERLVVDLEAGNIGKPIYVDNPFFDRELQEDAIGCATCHVQDGIVYGPRGDSPLAPHPVARGEHLLTEENCLVCHQAEAHFPDQNLACFFTTGTEFANSRFAEEGHTCQSCHMPQTTRKVAELFDVPERLTRHHWFGGSLIPKHPDFEEEIAALRPIFGSGASLALIANTEKKGCGDDENYSLAACPALAVEIYNEFAGHLFPTGDPERHVDVTFRVRTEAGDLLAESSLRIGSIYEWWPEIRLLSDNRIPPGESLYLPVPTFVVQPSPETPLFVEIEAHKYRMHQEAFDYHDLEGRYVRGRVFHTSLWRLESAEDFYLETIEDDFGSRKTLEPENLPTLFTIGD